MRDRAWRRAQMGRVRERVRRFLRLRYHDYSDDPRAVGMAATTPHPCSRRCCGNPRKHFKDKGTLQERRASA